MLWKAASSLAILVSMSCRVASQETGEREKKEEPKRQRWEPTSNSSDEEVVALPLPNRILFVGRHVSSDTQPCSGHVTMLCRIPASVGHIPPLCRL